MRRSQKDIEIQQALLQAEQPLPEGYAHMVQEAERSIMALHRAAVEQHHEERGTRNIAVHSSRAMTPKFEVPYYEEAKRLDPNTTASPIYYPKLMRQVTYRQFMRMVFRIAWNQFKRWMYEWMPLTYENLNLAHH